MNTPGKNAILIIHGIGQQKPYETLDSFVRGICNAFCNKNLKLHHHIFENSENNKKGSYVRIEIDGGRQYLDVYEYYWSHLTERQISDKEIYKWVLQTLKATENFATTYPDLVSNNLNVQKEWGISKYSKKVRMLRKYMFIIRWFGTLLAFLPPIKILDWFYKMFVEQLLVGYIGDIAVYTSIDIKSKHYETRKLILNGAINELKAILKSNIDYDNVILAGHSLGSVIAFDVLNKLNIEANTNAETHTQCQKVKKLITFGSPLDKTAFFFRDISNKNQYVRRQLLNHLYGFKVKNNLLYEGKENILLSSPVKIQFDHIKWLNFYHAKDPVSGHLDYYKVDENIVCRFENKEFEKFGIAHIGYWEHKPMYEKFLTDIFSS